MQHNESSTLHTLAPSGELIKGLVKAVKVALNEKYEFFPRKIGALHRIQYPAVQHRLTNLSIISNLIGVRGSRHWFATARNRQASHGSFPGTEELVTPGTPSARETPGHQETPMLLEHPVYHSVSPSCCKPEATRWEWQAVLWTHKSCMVNLNAKQGI